MKARSWPQIQPFSVLMTIAWIVGLFSAATAPLHELWRPLALATAGAALLTIGANGLGGRNRWAALGVGGGWLLALGAWPLALTVGLVVAWRLALDALRRFRGRRAVREPADEQILRVVNALAVASLIVAGLSLLTSGALRLASDTAAHDPLPAPQDAPSVVMVLLDGYPASAVLADEFGYDNSPFEMALAERGFDVVPDSRSNYNRTLLTVASMLHLDYVEDVASLTPARDGFAAQTRQLTAAIHDAPVPAMFRDAGYRTVAVGSTYGEATVTTMDVTVTTRVMTLFEEQLLRYSALGGWIIAQAPEIVAGQHRSGVLGVLEELEKLPLGGGTPVFAMGHVFSPHAPFLFGANGQPRPVQACYPSACGLTTPEADRVGLSHEAYGEGLTGQVQFLNGRLLEMVDALTARDPGAVIVLFSDHGARYEAGPADEHFRTFLAARTPGQEEALGDAITLVNVLPSLVNAYFGTALPIHESRFAWAPDEAPLLTVPVEPQALR